MTRKCEFKIRAVELFGGKCHNPDCPLPNRGKGLDEVIFDFHHRDPNEKDFTIGSTSRRTYSWEVLQLELKKCDMYCVVCHRMKHKSDKTLRRQIVKSGIGEKTYYDRRKNGLSHDEALNTPLQPGKSWNPKDTLEIDNITKSIKEWCVEYGVNYRTFKSRTYLRGWSPEHALKSPPTRKKIITVDGKSHSISEWCAIQKMSTRNYYQRIRKGWSPEKAVSTPISK